MTRILAVLAAFVSALGLGALAFVWSGWYDISANVQHTQLVYSLLEKTMHQSVKLRASGIEAPARASDTTVARGAACYVAKCVQCHGGPGAAQAEIARSMQPLPGPLVDASAKWRPSELYWITRNGIKMSGMPAWQHRLPDADLWALVAFMQRLPALTTAEFRAIAESGAGAQCALPRGEPSLQAPNIERGRIAITQYACNACHNVPGITGSDVHVGPPLAGIAGRGLIAGAVANTPELMARWLRDPRSIDPQTAMPTMAVSEQDARDIAAFLATLH